MRGLVGFKPSTGRVPRAAGLPVILNDFEVIGPMARTTADAWLLFAAIAGPDPRDRSSLAFSNGMCTLDREPGPQRVLYVPRFGTSPVDPEITAHVAEAARQIEALGHAIEEGDVPFDMAALDRIWGVIGPAGLRWFLHGQPGWDGVVQDSLRKVAEQGATLSALDYVDALNAVVRMRTAFIDIFDRYDAILTPCFAALPWPADASHPETIDGKPVTPRGHAVFTAYANVGGLPGISLPCRPSRSGLPIAIQLVSSFGADELLFEFRCTVRGRLSVG